MKEPKGGLQREGNWGKVTSMAWILGSVLQIEGHEKGFLERSTLFKVILWCQAALKKSKQ